MPDSPTIMWTARLGTAVTLLLSLVALSSVAARGAFTFQVLATGTAPDGPEVLEEFNARYAAHPWWTLCHLVSGFLFIVTGPWQFLASVRRRWRKLHRVLGRVFVASGVVSALTALAFVAELPVYGGFSSSVGAGLGSVLFLIAIFQAYRAARQKRFVEHREWMIRSYAMGLGIATFRVLLPLLMLPPLSATFVESWDTVIWLGFIVNLLVAETWINVTRPPLVSRAAAVEA